MRRTVFGAVLLNPVFLLVLGLSADVYAQARFVYVNTDAFGANSVAAFSVSSDGSLAPVPGSPFSTQGSGSDGGGFIATVRIVTSPIGNHLYASNNGNGGIAGFVIDPASGALTPVPGSPFPTGLSPANILTLALTPDGRFLMAAGGAHDLVVFAIDPGGTLSQVGQYVLPGGAPDGLKVSPNGRLLFVPMLDSNAVAVYAIASDGTLTQVPGSPYLFGAEGLPTSVEADCAGTYVYVMLARFNGAAVAGFRILADDSLSPTPGSPYIFTSANNSNTGTLSPDDQFLYVANSSSGQVTALSVAADGSLSQIPGSPFTVPDSMFPYGITTDQSGTQLYVSEYRGGVSVFSIDGDGSLTAVPGSPFATPGIGGKWSIAAFPAKQCGSPFVGGAGVCVVDDASGDTFSEVVDHTSPRYGYWEYRVAATGQVITGVANRVSFAPGRSLVSYDTDYSAENPYYAMSVNISFATNSGTVTVRRRDSMRYVLRDRNLHDDPPCS